MYVSLEKLNNQFKRETVIRILIAVIGILTFSFSTSFGWGFILGAIVSKEGISLQTKEGWGLLALITGVMLVAIYFLLDTPAVYGYIASTIVYFILKDLLIYMEKNQNNRNT